MNTRLLSQWHGFVGAFIAPSVILFALTGALQLFNLHEAHGAYRPAPLIERLGRVHKDQVFALDEHDGPPPPQAQTGAPAQTGAGANTPGPSAPHEDDDKPALTTVLLKWFFLVVALGLAASTGLGVWIGLTRPQGRALTIALLVIGTAIPVVLLLI